MFYYCCEKKTKFNIAKFSQQYLEIFHNSFTFTSLFFTTVVRRQSLLLESLTQEYSSGFFDEESKIEIKEILETATNEEEICISLICLFFASKVNKNQFNLILEFVKIFANVKLPTNFDTCANLLTRKCEQTLQIEVSGYSQTRLCENIVKGIKCNEK